MNKKLIAAFSVLQIAAIAFGAVGCGDDDPAKRGKVQLTLHAVINENNKDVMTQLVQKFNETNARYTVKLVPKTAGYSAQLGGMLKGSNPPNIVQIDDRYFKDYINEGYLTSLDEYFTDKKDENGTVVRAVSTLDLTDIWQSAVDRLRYDPQTGYSGGSNPLYGLPAGVAPTMMAYNATALKSAGVNIISVEEADAAQQGYPAKGYFTTKDDKKYFNNRIPMSWEELVEISKLFTRSYTSSSPTTYGFFNEWWFSLGWSVGGDCLEWDESKNQYVMALGEETPNYLVTGENGAQVNGTSYAEGEILSYADKHYVAQVLAGSKTDEAVNKYKQDEVLYELPSIRDAFTLFLQMPQSKTNKVTDEKYGLAISPTPTIIGNKSKKDLLTSNEVAFVVDNYDTYNYGKSMSAQRKEWDLCPLYQYREFDAQGNLKEVNGTQIKGKEAGHLGSISYAIPEKSKSKDGSFEFIEFMAGPEAQKALMKTNFYVPNQKSIAYSEEYMSLTENYFPSNKQAILTMTACGSVGDWSYLEDGEWVNIWAKVLNSDVRNGSMTLNQFFEHECIAQTNEALKGYRAKKYNG